MLLLKSLFILPLHLFGSFEFTHQSRSLFFKKRLFFFKKRLLFFKKRLLFFKKRLLFCKGYRLFVKTLVLWALQRLLVNRNLLQAVSIRQDSSSAVKSLKSREKLLGETKLGRIAKETYFRQKT